MTVPPRYRLPVAIAASVAVVLLVLVAVLVTSGGQPDAHRAAQPDRVGVGGSRRHARGCRARVLRRLRTRAPKPTTRRS